jgi:hypothetical protein
MGVGLTELPLRAGRRPVTAHASATHGVGLLSVPALGARNLQRLLLTAVLHLIEGLLGESVGGGRADDPGRRARIARRLGELGRRWAGHGCATTARSASSARRSAGTSGNSSAWFGRTSRRA